MAEAIRMSLARCGEEFSTGELAAVLLQFASEIRLFEYCAIDNTAGGSPVLNVEHSPDIGCTVFGEALIGPAKCVRRHDDAVEREKRIGRIGWFLLEDIVETNEFDTESGRQLGIRKWIMGDESHVERLGEAE